MKKTVFLTWVVVLLLAAVCQPAHAEESPTDSLADFYNALPPEVYPLLDGRLESEQSAGELIGMEALLDYALDAAKEGFSLQKGSLFKILGVTLLSVLAGLFCRGMQSESSALLCERAVGLVSTLAFFGVLSDSLFAVTAWCADLSTFCRGLAPVLTGLLLFGGNAGGATASGVAMSAFLLVSEEIASGFLFGLISVLFALVLVGCFGKRDLTEGIFSFVRTVYLTVISLIGTLLCASLGFQSMLSSSADTLAARTAKFALGNLVPVVGGTVSATLGTAAASLAVLRGTVGIGAVVTVLLLTLPHLFSLWYLRMCFSLCGSLAGMLGCPEVCRQQKNFRGLFDLLMATVAILSVLLLFIVTVFAKSAVAFAV